MDPPELAFKFVFGFGSVDVSGLWIVFLLFFKIDNEKLIISRQTSRQQKALGLRPLDLANIVGGCSGCYLCN